MNNKSFLVVNAFAREPFGGNPAGVFPNAAGLSDEIMQSIARQLNLVETVFVFPAESLADFRLRYFTPTAEIPVAGHPSVAAWYALWHEKLVDTKNRTQYTQVNKAGVQHIQVEVLDQNKTIITMQQPEPKFLPGKVDVQQVLSVFGLNPDDINVELPIEAVDTGLGHLIVPLKTLDALMRVERKIEPLRNLCQSLKVREAQLFCFETKDKRANAHTRNLCPREGLEDPACGVGNGALAAYLAKNFSRGASETKLQIEQGLIVNMPSIIHTRSVREADAIRVFVGGSAVIMLRGQMVF